MTRVPISLALALVACGAWGCRAPEARPITTRDLFVDMGRAPAALWADTRATFTDRRNVTALALAGGYALVAETFEDQERRYLDRMGVYGDSTSTTLQSLGDGGVLFLGALGLTAYGVATDRATEYEAGKVAAESLFVTGAATLAAKVLIPDQRPNGRTGDFPSGHSSMAMAMATAIDSQYGGITGLVAYGTALAIGLQRLDSDHHDVAAVLAGWTLGYVTARSVAERRAGGSDVHFSFAPMIDPELRAVGVALHWSF